MQTDYPEIILASASGARAAILASAGIRFRQKPSHLDEAVEHKQFNKGISPEEIARTLARLKAESVLKIEPDAVVIGADQVLSVGGEVLQKPATQAEAREQLKKLRGRVHHLHSAAVVSFKDEIASFSDTATMTVRDFSDEFLDWYLEAAGEGILSSVGAYHIEALGIHLFSEIKGDYFTVLGMPVLPVLEELRRLKIVMR